MNGMSITYTKSSEYVSDEWNDRFMSYRVFPGTIVVAYSDRDFGGESIALSGAVANMDPEWRKAISSVKVLTWGGDAPPVDVGKDKAETGTAPVQEGNYQIVAQHSGKCLMIEGESASSGALLKQATCGSSKAQVFRVVHLSNGNVQFIAAHSGMGLMLRSQKTRDEVVQWGSADIPSQRFKIVQGDYGNFYITTASEKVLQVRDASPHDGGTIDSSVRSAGLHQQFKFTPVP